MIVAGVSVLQGTRAVRLRRAHAMASYSVDEIDQGRQEDQQQADRQTLDELMRHRSRTQSWESGVEQPTPQPIRGADIDVVNERGQHAGNLWIASAAKLPQGRKIGYHEWDKADGAEREIRQEPLPVAAVPYGVSPESRPI